MAYYKSSIENNEKVEFIHVSQDDSRRDATGWAASAGFPWLSVMKTKVRASGLHKYDSGTPSYALVDKNGKVLATSEKDCMRKIKELTGQ